ncbi:hypothetical protein EDD15DRAFT_2268908 [Pisolithus albus]|nr:hypothetical protein EDD15DRAFT_2268908 [Pisolithus albus]
MTGEQSRSSSLLSRPDPHTTYKFQLKGAGRTPFSRSADGLAVLRSSMLTAHSSSHACVGYPYHPVSGNAQSMCDNQSRGTLIRMGNFEALSPPSRATFYFGGGQRHADYEALGDP